MSVLQSKIEEQQKLIEFLTSKYEKDTGRKVALPTSLGELLGDQSILGTVKSQDMDPQHFID